MELNVFTYTVFSAALFFWTTSSLKYESRIPFIGYLAGVILLESIIILLHFSEMKNEGKHEMNGIVIAAVLMNLGLSVDYRCFDYKDVKNIFENTYLTDLLLMIPAFMIIFALIRYTKLYRYRVFNYLILLALPVSIFGARLSGRLTGGSYLYFAGVMIFGIVLMGFPFAAAWFMSSEENRYLRGRVGNISWNLIGFLLYDFIIYFGCVLCNEYGLLLITGLTASILFFVRCKDIKSKLFYTVSCAGGALLASVKISHLWSRVQIWLHPVTAFHNDGLKEKAESVLYLFRNINGMGWWGKGIGNLSKRIYPTINTDHVLVLLINDYSVLLFIFVVVLGILFVRWMLSSPKDMCAYDRYLNLACASIVCFIILIDVASNLGSFITAGIGFPWISDGSSVNLMLTVLMAIHCALLRKRVVKDA